jgi:hypothetical protein
MVLAVAGLPGVATSSATASAGAQEPIANRMVTCSNFGGRRDHTFGVDQVARTASASWISTSYKDADRAT